MRISGQRADGALHLSLGGGVAVILKGGCVTPTLDETVVDAMGPWEPADNEYTVRREVERRLDNASLAGMEFFDLGGPGSGNFGHAGRPGQEGGSGGGGGSAKESKGESKGEGEKHNEWAGHPDELDEAAAKAAGEYWNSPEGQRVKAEGAKRSAAWIAKDDAEKLARKAGNKPNEWDVMVEKGKLEKHAGRAGAPAGFSAPTSAHPRTASGGFAKGKDTEFKAAPKYSAPSLEGSVLHGQSEGMKRARYEEMHGKGRAGARGGSLSTAFAESIINAAKAAAAWKESGTSEAMRANIARNTVYRQTIPHLSLGVGLDAVTDEHLFDLTEQMSGDDLLILAAAFGLSEADRNESDQEDGGGEGEGRGRKQDTQEGLSESGFGEHVKKEDAIALDQYHSLDDEEAEGEKKEPVSEIAKAAQGDKTQPALPSGEVMNLPPAVIVADPAEERKKRRMALLEKVRKAARSKGRAADTLESEEISDEDLFAMAKELGVTLDETPEAVVLVDNATKFSALLASTTHAKHIHLAGGEHPFQYCIDTVIPAMEREGKGPDDPEAFCAYWKAENA